MDQRCVQVTTAAASAYRAPLGHDGKPLRETLTGHGGAGTAIAEAYARQAVARKMG